MRTATPSDPTEEARLLVKVSALASRFARRLLPPDDAESMAQQVVLDCLVLLRSGHWHVHTSVRALVRDMVHRKYLGGLLHETNSAACHAKHVEGRRACPPAWMDPAVSLDMKEIEALRAQALAELSERCRVVYLLVREEGVSHRFVAARLGISSWRVAEYLTTAEQHIASRVLDRCEPAKTSPSLASQGPRRRLATRGEVRRRRVVTLRRAGPTTNEQWASVKRARTRKMFAETSATDERTSASNEETTPAPEQGT